MGVILHGLLLWNAMLLFSSLSRTLSPAMGFGLESISNEDILIVNLRTFGEAFNINELT